MREYAARKLGEAGERDDLERRCTDYYVATCARHVAAAPGSGFPPGCAWMDLEIDNIRSVLRRCLVSSDSMNGITLATSLSWYWITRATTEGVRWLDELLASGPGDPATLGWSWFIRGFLAVLQGDFEPRPRLGSNARSTRRATQGAGPARELLLDGLDRGEHGR